MHFVTSIRRLQTTYFSSTWYICMYGHLSMLGVEFSVGFLNLVTFTIFSMGVFLRGENGKKIKIILLVDLMACSSTIYMVSS